MIDQFYLELILAIATFFVGMYIVTTKKNLIRIMMGVETMILSAQLILIIVGKNVLPLYDPLLQAVLILLTILAAAVVAVFMGLIYLSYKNLGTIDASKLKELRW